MALYSIWALPILFILHDFEEMIFMPLWKKTPKFQHLQNKEKYFGGVTNGSAFSIGVLEEFVILLCISLFCEYSHNTKIYLGFCIAYTLHFFIHFLLCFRYRGYVPGVVTVTLQIPVMAMIINHYFSRNLSSLVFIILAVGITYVNLYIMHKAMPVIQIWLFEIFDQPIPTAHTILQIKY